jgi:Flp pilus assembly protein TadD
LETESAKYPNRPDLVLAAGTVALRSGRYDIAISEFQKLLDMMDKTSTNRAEVYLRLGETYRSKGDYTSAIENLNKAREISPDRPDVLGTLGLVLDAAQRRGEARQVYEAALKKSPDNPILMNNLAFLLSENNGDLELALTYAQRAKQALPEMSEVNDTLGWIMLKKDLSDQAIDTFRQLVNKYPDHATYRYHLCMALNQKGDRMGALKECRQALNSSPSDEDKGKIEAEIKKLQ